MAEVKWIKLRVDIFDDEKIRLVESMPEGDALLVVWIKLLALAGKVNDDGRIYVAEGLPYTDEMLAIVFGRDLQVIRLALQTFVRFGMIEIEDGEIALLNWAKHQNVKSLEDMRERGRERVQRFREKKNKKEKERGEGNVTCNVTPRTHHGPKVLLSEAEYGRLCERYSQAAVEHYIEAINSYCVSHGKTYADYNQTIHNWIKRDQEAGKYRFAAPGSGQSVKRCPDGHEYTGTLCRRCGWSELQEKYE